VVRAVQAAGPLLEKVVAEANGAGEDGQSQHRREPEIARQLRIQSIPAVFAFRTANRSTASWARFPRARYASSWPASRAAAMAATITRGSVAVAQEAFDAGDVTQAAQAYAHVLQDEPGHPKAVAGLARCYLKSGDVERAKTTLQLVRPDARTDEAVVAVQAELKLREQSAAAVSGLDAAKAKVEANPADLQARYDYALALGGRKTATGADAAARHRQTRPQVNEEARASTWSRYSRAMGPTDPRTIDARKRLSSILFS